MHSITKLRKSTEIPGVDVVVFYTDVDQALVDVSTIYIEIVEYLQARRPKEGTQ
jgi:hypothetical protein